MFILILWEVITLEKNLTNIADTIIDHINKSEKESSNDNKNTISKAEQIKIFLWRIPFGKLDSELVESLKDITDNRSEWIRSKAYEQFKFELNKDNIVEFEKILNSNFYKDKAEWLREIVRKEVIAHKGIATQ